MTVIVSCSPVDVPLLGLTLSQLLLSEIEYVKVPPPEFLTLNVWLEALLPSVQELDKEAVPSEMLGGDDWAFTVRLNGIVCGELLALESLMVMVAE